jgi:hypothetical protein
LAIVGLPNCKKGAVPRPAQHPQKSSPMSGLSQI